MNRAASAGMVLALVIAHRPIQAQNWYLGAGAEPVRVPRSVLERYVGEYAYPAGNSMMIFLRGDTLFRETRGQLLRLEPISETRFRAGPVFTAEFVVGRAGEMTQILSDGVAMEFRLRRKASGVAARPAPATGTSLAPETPAVRVPASLLQRYAGDYEFIPGQMGRTDLFVVVRQSGDTLLGLVSALPEVVLTPISDTRFKLGSTSIVWEFTRDEGGGVTLAMGTGSQQLKARRKQKTQVETPASRALSEWLDAFNSGDSTKLRAYYDRYQLTRSMTAQLALRQRTGGFDLISIEKNKPRYIEFVVKERATETRAVGVVELNAEGTPGVRQWALLAIPAGKTLADFTIDSARRARVIDRAIERLDEDYVFSDVAQKMAADVRARFKRGEYDDVTNAITFASRLTEHLRAVSRDKHLGVAFSPGGLSQGPPPGAAPNGPPSCGFNATLEPKEKIGVVRFNGFPNLTQQCGSEVTRAFDIVADADALIFDLRQNTGGDARMVAFISSYLFDGRTHLNDVMTRRRDASGRLVMPEQFWTNESWANDPDVPGRKYGGKKPVYVLTSHLTFSAAEEFTYNLQSLKRATIIGEQTGGGAHPTRPAKIDDQFSINVPFARSVNPITRTNWEGTGVTPDVKVPAAQALDTAKSLIARKAKP